MTSSNRDIFKKRDLTKSNIKRIKALEAKIALEIERKTKAKKEYDKLKIKIKALRDKLNPLESQAYKLRDYTQYEHTDNVSALKRRIVEESGRHLSLQEQKKIFMSKDRTLWKKCQSYGLNRNGIFVGRVLVELFVPKNTDVYSSDYKDKIRVAKAKVMGFYFEDGTPIDLKKYPILKVTSIHDRNFIYKVNKIVKPTKEFSTYDITCSTGIHGFLTKVSARNYRY